MRAIIFSEVSELFNERNYRLKTIIQEKNESVVYFFGLEKPRGEFCIHQIGDEIHFSILGGVDNITKMLMKKRAKEYIQILFAGDYIKEPIKIVGLQGG